MYLFSKTTLFTLSYNIMVNETKTKCEDIKEVTKSRKS